MFNVNCVEDLAMFVTGWWLREGMISEEVDGDYHELIHGFQAYLNKELDPNYNPEGPTSWATIIRFWSGQSNAGSLYCFKMKFENYLEHKKMHANRLKSSFGTWVGDETAEEIIEAIRSARTTNSDPEPF